MNTLGEYLNQIRLRHPRLSMRRMSLECGLSENAVSKIIKGEFIPKPDTLKELVDRWGTPEDYRELLRLAGHPLPEPGIRLPPEGDIDAALQIVREARDLLSVEAKDELIAMLIGDLQAYAVNSALLRQTEPEEKQPLQGDLEVEYDSDFIKTASFDELLALVMQLSVEERKQWLAESIYRLLYGSEHIDDDGE